MPAAVIYSDTNSEKSPANLQIVSALAASAPPHRRLRIHNRTSGSWRQLDGFPMSKVTRIVAVFLTVATSGLLAAVPVVATWRIPAGQCIAPAPTNPLKLGEQAAAMPLVAGQCTIAGSSLKQPELIADPVWLDW
jgi:hypothetical protein